MTIQRVNQDQQRDIYCRELTLRAASVNEEERSIEGVFSTESAVSVYDWGRDEMIDEVLVSTGARHAQQMPFLDSHQRASMGNVLGSATGIRAEGGEVIGKIRFLKDDPISERAWKLVRDGHQKDLSVGYRTESYVDIPPGETRSVAGKSYTAGKRRMRITTSYRIREVSLVPIGADQAAKIRADGCAPQLEINMKPETLKYLESLGLRAEATAEQAAAFRDALGGEQATRAAAIEEGKEVFPPKKNEPEPQRGSAPVAGQSGFPAGNADHSEAIRAERERIEEIRGLATADTSPELISKAVKEGWSVERAAKAILQQERDAAPEAASPFAMHSRSREKDLTKDVLSAALQMRTGGFNAPTGASPERLRQYEQLADQAHRFSDWSLSDMCREACRIDKARINGAEPQSREDFIRAGLSTPTLSYAFTNSVNARLIGAYEEAGDTTDFCESVDVADFKEQQAITLGMHAGLKKLARGKTAEHSTFDDKQETYKIARYAKQMVVDEQDVIDDNLDVFSTIAPQMGMAAGRLRGDLVYYMILSNPTLAADSTTVFHSNHGNTDSNALSAANLKAGVTKMRKQQQNSVNLNIAPAYLVGCTTLEWTMRELLNSASLVIAGTAGSVTERSSKNLIADLGLQMRVDARFDNGVVDPDSGSTSSTTTTGWYLFSKPFRTIRVAYRAGTGRRPAVRTFTLDRGQWGIGWDINMDIGCKFLDYRGCYKGNA